MQTKKRLYYLHSRVRREVLLLVGIGGNVWGWALVRLSGSQVP